MARFTGVEGHQEIDSSDVWRDTRWWWVRTGDWLSHPRNFAIAMAGVGITAFAAPAIAPVLLPVTVLLGARQRSRLRPMPLRVPKHIGAPDPTDLNPKTKKPSPGDGILYLGNDRSATGENRECWVSNSDARTHMMALGTTGSGKSEFLMSLSFNALAWGSGFIYVDGKADNSLPFKIYSMCKRLGREDDFRVINFMTGDTEAFARQRDETRFSNTMNPFEEGGSKSLTQLVSSLMAEAGGDNAMWKGLAIGMIDAVITGLAYKRWSLGEAIDAYTLRDYVELGKLMELTREFAEDPDVPKDLVYKPLEAYLVNLPGFDWTKNMIRGETPGEDTKKQHDFRSMQFLRQLTMLADTYGNIFRHRLPEVDMLDIVLKRRILVVMIPSLEKSEEESEGVGKLVVTSLRMMMAKTLGAHVEGMYSDAVESKLTNAPSPFICVLDELGYYFTKGLAVMFAQARSLGFMMVAAGQDLPAMMKGKNKEEAESVIANTKYKVSLAMEDPQSTADLIIKTAGEAIVSETSGYSGMTGFLTNANYQDMLNASVTKRNRVTLQELRDMDSGQGILLWRDRVIRFATFYLFGSAKITKKTPMRLNRMVKLFAPEVAELADVTKAASAEQERAGKAMEAFLSRQQRPEYCADPTPFITAFRESVVDFPEDKNVAPRDGDIAFYEHTIAAWLARMAGGSENDTAQDAASAGGSSGGGLRPSRAPVAPPPAPVTNVPVQETVTADVVDVADFVDMDAFPLAAKADVVRDGSSALAADIPDAPPASGDHADQLDWVDTAVDGVVLESDAASMLAMMDSVLMGGDDVAVETSATETAQQLMDATAYQPPEPWHEDEGVGAKVDDIKAMFEDF